jgi:hypothetical protein
MKGRLRAFLLLAAAGTGMGAVIGWLGRCAGGT